MKIVFISSEKLDSPSATHRCFPFLRELTKYGFEGEVLFRRDIGKIVNRGLRSDIIIFQRWIRSPAQVLLLFFKCMGKKTVFDFDDSLFYPSPGTRKHRRILHFLRARLTNFMIKKSDIVFAGSRYLKKYAKQINRNTYLVPTPVDLQVFRPIRKKKTETVTIGWFGSGESHFEFLRLLKHPLKEIAKEPRVKLMLLGCANSDRIKAYFGDLEMPIDYGPPFWIDFEKIPSYISEMDINVMPLTNTPWAKGKCGTKILEAMAMEIPSVASYVGENKYIIEDGRNGYLAKDGQEFLQKLRILVKNEQLRQKMGKAGRKTVETRYSLEICTRRIVKLLSHLPD